MKKQIFLASALASSLGALLASSQALAEPAFARLYKQEYGYQPSCNACHKDGGGSPLNEYGKQFEQAKMNRAAFAAIAALDADADGHSNAEEAKAKSNPADSASKPGEIGDWLDTSNLIPKAVQAVFEGVTKYKPLDAIFTAKEIKRAKAMGVALSAADENTIYIPIAKGKAAGTAIIVPAQYQGKQYFVLLATDRGLTVTHAKAVSTNHVEGAEKLAAYSAAIGKKVNQLAAGEGESLDASAATALQKAGAMLLVRLKKK